MAIVTVLSCVGGCFYKYQHVGSRGVEVVPFIDAIRTCLYDFSEFLTVRVCVSVCQGAGTRPSLPAEPAAALLRTARRPIS